VLSILEQLDAELDSRAMAGRGGAGSPGNSTFDTRGDSHGADAWGFVDALRTLRLINNGDTWFVCKGSSGSVLWVRGDGSRYCCDSATARVIRMGTRNLSGLTLHKAVASPAHLNPSSGSELAWFAGYHTSAALAPWLSERKTYRLTRWPDFGRIQPDDPSLRAAQIRVLAALDAAPDTPIQLSARTNTSPEIVVRTLNALASCDLVEVAPTVATNVASPTSAKALPAGRLVPFLRTMRKHLGLWTSA
jgi:hypothetical protein